MQFWRDIVIGILSGLAFRRFIQQRYREAACLFERICKTESNKSKNIDIYSYLGRCYVFLEEYADAVNVLSKAYDLFDKRDRPIEQDFDKKEYKEFLRAYSYALYKVGLFEKHTEVKDKLEAIENEGT